MNLKHYLFFNEISVKDFAEGIKTHPSYIFNIMAGRCNPGPKLMEKIRIATNGEVTAKDWTKLRKEIGAKEKSINGSID